MWRQSFFVPESLKEKFVPIDGEKSGQGQLQSSV